MEEKQASPQWNRKDANLRSIFLLEMLHKAKLDFERAEHPPVEVSAPVPMPGPVTPQRHREPVMSRFDRLLFRFNLPGLHPPIESTARFEPPRPEIRSVEPVVNKPQIDQHVVAEKKLEIDTRHQKVLNSARTVEQLKAEPWAAVLIPRLAHYRGTFTGVDLERYDALTAKLPRMVSVLREAVGWIAKDEAEPELYAPAPWAASFQKDIHAVAEEINSMVAQQVVDFKSMQDRGLSAPSGGLVP